MAHANNFLAKGYGDDRQFLPPFKLLDDSGNSLFSVDSSGNVIAAGTLTGSGTVDGGGNASFTTLTVSGASTLTGDATFGGNLILAAAKKLDASALGGGDAVVKFTLTTDTPTVAFGANSGHDASTSPAGFLKVLVGSTPYYIPVWA